MTFLSLSFLLYFAIFLVLYYALPHKWQWVLLLLASYAFYILCGLEYIAFLLFTTLTAFLAIRFMDKQKQKEKAFLQTHKEDLGKEEKKAYKKQQKGRCRTAMLLCIILNFGILFFCKACLIRPFSALIQGTGIRFLSLALPMGMSFYMFQSVGYVIDVYRGKAAPLTNLFKMALFTGFFPQLVQGPISRFEQLKDSLFSAHAFDRKEIAFGLQRMLWGFFKKLVIADRIAVAIGALKAEQYTGVSFLVLTCFYAVQIYGDFTGGIDIAIGIAQTLGIRLPENFIHPFFSKNIAEYWRRWHITLNEWMKRYIFYPITVSKPMLLLSLKARGKLGKFGMRIPVYIGSVLTWLMTGIWHGFDLHFIVWGMLNCVVIVISEELSPLYQRFHRRFAFSNKRGYGVFQIIRMFFLMNLIRATDLFADVGDYFGRVASLTYCFNFSVLWDGSMLQLGLSVWDYVILLCGILFMFAVSVLGRKGSVRERMQGWHAPIRYAIIIALLLAVVLFGSYGIGYNASSFIYNRF